jgi:hypothetical protein
MSEKLAAEDPSSGHPAQMPSDYSAGVRILARSFYRQLRSCGYTPRHLLALSSELIELITLDLQKRAVL